MQKLVYVRYGGRLGDPETSLEFSRDGPYILSNSPEGIQGLTARLITAEVPTIDGTVRQGYKYENRPITAKITIKGNSRQDMYEKREQLCNKVAPFLGKEGYLYYYNDAGVKRIKAFPTETPKEDKRIKNYYCCSISFTCCQPFWESIEPETVYLCGDGNSFQLPFFVADDHPVRFSGRSDYIYIDNEGTAETPIEVYISGPQPAFTLRNETTGESIIIQNPLYANENMYINTTPREKAIRINDSVSFQYLKIPESKMWSLVPGRNKITFNDGTADPTVQIRIDYRPRYRGV